MDMFNDYSDVRELMHDIKESKLICRGIDVITVISVWGFCEIYPVPNSETDNKINISYEDLMLILPILTEEERMIPHNITVDKSDQIVYGDDDSPVRIIINKSQEHAEMMIFILSSPFAS